MTPFRVGRTKRGDVRVEIVNTLTNCWHGFSLTDDEARGLADALLRAVRPTASEMTHDVDLEP